MSYYNDKRKAAAYIRNKISSCQKGDKIPVVKLELKFLQSFGFGEKILYDLLRKYEKIGLIKYDEEEVEVL